MPFCFRDVTACIGLLMLSLAVYWQVSSFDYVSLDDALYVSSNPHVFSGLSMENTKWAFTNLLAGYWIPVTWLSFMANAQLFGMGPASFHLTNVGFHTANCILIFLLLSRATKTYWRSLMVVALFAVHPLQVEAVAWVTQRKDVLATFLTLSSSVFWWRWVSKSSGVSYAIAGLLFIMALMAKPIAVTLPWAWVLLDFWPLQRTHLGFRKLVMEKIPFMVVSIFMAIATVIFLKITGFNVSLESLSLFTRLENAIVCYAQAVGNIFWPSDLAVFYPHPGDAIPLWQTLLTGFIIFMVTLIAIMLRKSRPWLLVGWLGFLGILFPTTGMFQAGLQAGADRFTYLAIIGIFVIVVWEVHEFSLKWRMPDAVFAMLSVMVLSAFTITASRQTGYWSDSISLFSRAIEVTGGNYVLHANIGETYSTMGDEEMAMVHLKKSISLNPEHARAHYALGNLFVNQGRIKEALQSFQNATRSQPDFAQAHNNMGSLLLRTGRDKEAMQSFKTAIDIWPEYVDALNNLSLVLISAGDYVQARSLMKRALQLAPEDPELKNNMGILLTRMGDLPGAVTQFSKALALSQDYAEARVNLHTVQAELERLISKRK